VPINGAAKEIAYMSITTADVVTCLRKMADVIHENKEYLTRWRT